MIITRGGLHVLENKNIKVLRFVKPLPESNFNYMAIIHNQYYNNKKNIRDYESPTLSFDSCVHCYYEQKTKQTFELFLFLINDLYLEQNIKITTLYAQTNNPPETRILFYLDHIASNIDDEIDLYFNLDKIELEKCNFKNITIGLLTNKLNNNNLFKELKKTYFGIMHGTDTFYSSDTFYYYLNATIGYHLNSKYSNLTPKRLLESLEFAKLLMVNNFHSYKNDYIPNNYLKIKNIVVDEKEEKDIFDLKIVKEKNKKKIIKV
jgi:hypothetical protein